MTTTITDSNFEAEVLKSNQVVLVDCYADWCGPCKALKPLLAGLEGKNEGLKLGLMDIDHNPETVERLKVHSIPKVVVFHNGEEITSMYGLRPEADYQDVIDSC